VASDAPGESPSATAPLQDLPQVLALPNYPLSLSDRPTTAGQVAMDHLQGSLAQAEREFAAAQLKCQAPCRPVRQQARLAGLLFQRYQWLGSLADLDRVVELLQQIEGPATTGAHQDPSLVLLMATVHAHMHQFAGAKSILLSLPETAQRQRLLAEIDAATKLPAPSASAALPARELSVGQEVEDLIERAHECILKGDLNCASQHFHAAQFIYHDVAPVPLAWLHTQQGIALLRFGHPEAAIPFFRAAVARAPNDLLASEHLAECLSLTGGDQEALGIYQTVVKQSGNPEFIAAMGDLQAKLGMNAEAERSLALARKGFAERLARFPSAYTMHAVGFYLEHDAADIGLKLARENILLRQDSASWLLLAEAALANGQEAEACQALTKVRQAQLNPPEAKALALQLPDCS